MTLKEFNNRLAYLKIKDCVPIGEKSSWGLQRKTKYQGIFWNVIGIIHNGKGDRLFFVLSSKLGTVRRKIQSCELY